MFICKENDNRIINRKIVVCGDGACGKTSLLSVFTRNYFPQVYEPTVFENYVQELTIDNQNMELSLWDTAGQEEFDRIRLLSYSGTHVFMLCFSVENRDSMLNIADKWLDEITDFSPHARLILVALKCDLRETTQDCILYEEGLALAKRIHAVRYLECSAKHNRGVKECFEQSARVALTVKLRSSSSSAPSNRLNCTIL